MKSVVRLKAEHELNERGLTLLEKAVDATRRRGQAGGDGRGEHGPPARGGPGLPARRGLPVLPVLAWETGGQANGVRGRFTAPRFTSWAAHSPG
jgi:hypothetical protein